MSRMPEVLKLALDDNDRLVRVALDNLQMDGDLREALQARVNLNYAILKEARAQGI